MTPEQRHKLDKKRRKRERRKQMGKIKHRMEVARTCSSLGALTLALLGFLHAYHII